MPDARRLTLPATLDSLGSVRAFAREAAEQAGVDPRRTYGLQIALDEIATNVVTHGYGAAGLSDDDIEMILDLIEKSKEEGQ